MLLTKSRLSRMMQEATNPHLLKIPITPIAGTKYYDDMKTTK